ncbi:MFS transporter [Actinomadura rudentiformis]|uniref:MFS transporter n=1 Tax=Actinomadura rudentiformis TaxID=359158 RepID=A0A6H9Z3R5_9ACTN|nr:MFS transporter [Actinomadura rudentiformis]KAB2349451.1 MFS transporter [Actinomadura rudentiformis]
MPAARSRTGWALALLAFAQLIIALDFNIVYVALPEIGRELSFSDQGLQWVVSAYAVVFGGFLLLGGRASDLLGRRRMFALALSLYAGSSLAGGLAEGPGLLIAARAVQGLGGALLFPATLSLINTTFAEGRERNRALAIWGGAGASGLSLGSLLGGVLTDAFGWESVFYVNVPLAGAAALLAFVLLARDGRREQGRGFDLPGALTVTAGVTLFVFALVQGPETGWTAPEILAAFGATAVLLAVFAWIEGRAADPLMPLRLFTNRSLSAGMAITFTFMGTFGALPYFLTIYLQSVHAYSPLATGLAFLVPSLAIAAGTQIGERLVGRIGLRATLLGGLLVGAPGTALIAYAITADGSYAALLPGILISGLGQGVTWTGMWIAAASGVDAGEQGVASGMASTAQQVGGAVGLAILVALTNSGLDGLSGEALRAELAGGIQTATYVAAAGILLGALITLGLKKQARAPEPDRAPLAPEPVLVED